MLASLEQRGRTVLGCDQPLSGVLGERPGRLKLLRALAWHGLPAGPADRAQEEAWGWGLGRRKGSGAHLDCPRVPSLLVVN